MNTPALTIHQPWASLIAAGVKHVENRKWRTHYRGPVWIHASKRRHPVGRIEPLPTQAIIARVTIVDCVEYASAAETLLYTHLIDDPHATGPYCFILEDIEELAQPVPCRGYQRLWIPKGELAVQLEHAV